MFNTIEHDKLDQLIYANHWQKSDRLRTTVESQQDRLDTIRELSEDVYYSMSKHNPKMVDDVPATHRLNSELISNMTESKEYQKLRIYTRGNSYESTMATNCIMQKILGSVDDEQLYDANQASRKHIELSKEIESLLREIDDWQQKLESARPDHPDFDKLNRAKDQLQQSEQHLEQVEGQLDQQMEDMELD